MNANIASTVVGLSGAIKMSTICSNKTFLSMEANLFNYNFILNKILNIFMIVIYLFELDDFKFAVLVSPAVIYKIIYLFRIKLSKS